MQVQESSSGRSSLTPTHFISHLSSMSMLCFQTPLLCSISLLIFSSYQLQHPFLFIETIKVLHVLFYRGISRLSHLGHRRTPSLSFSFLQHFRIFHFHLTFTYLMKICKKNWNLIPFLLTDLPQFPIAIAIHIFYWFPLILSASKPRLQYSYCTPLPHYPSQIALHIFFLFPFKTYRSYLSIAILVSRSASGPTAMSSDSSQPLAFSHFTHLNLFHFLF